MESTALSLLSDPLNTPVVYYVKSGDTLSQIITRYYDCRYGDRLYKLALNSVLYYNKGLTNQNYIRPHQVIRLMPLYELGMSSCPVPVPDVVQPQSQGNNQVTQVLEPVMGDHTYDLDGYLNYIPTDPQEREAFWALAWLQSNYDFLAIPAGAGFNVLGGLVNQQNTALIAEVETLWNQYDRGFLTKGQYDYRRARALEAFAQRLGPFERVLLRGQTARQAIRIVRSRALPATANVTRNLSRLRGLATVASRGGVVLTAAGVAKGCYDIAQTNSRQEKNEILVETVMGSIASVATGAILSAVLVATPVGWATILVLGTAAAVGSTLVGKGSKMIYDQYFNQYDLADMTGIDHLCSR